MIACFKNSAGKVIARHYTKRAPPKAIFDGNDWYERDDSVAVPVGDGSSLPGIIMKDREVVSMQAPLKGSRWDNPNNPAPAYNRDGQAVFSNRRQMKEWAKGSENEHGTYAVDD